LDKDSVIELFLLFVLLFFFINLIGFDHLICLYVLFSFSHPATVCQ